MSETINGSTQVATKSKTTALKKLNEKELISKIKKRVALALTSERQAIEHWVHAGTMLIELKSRKPKGPWGDYVRKHFDLGQSRADELIRIAKGQTTVAEVRSNKAERMRASRAAQGEKSAPRGAELPKTEIVDLGPTEYSELKAAPEIADSATTATPTEVADASPSAVDPGQAPIDLTNGRAAPEGTSKPNGRSKGRKAAPTDDARTDDEPAPTLGHTAITSVQQAIMFFKSLHATTEFRSLLKLAEESKETADFKALADAITAFNDDCLCAITTELDRRSTTVH